MRVCTRCGNLAAGPQQYCPRCVAPLDPPEASLGPPEPPGTALLLARPRPVALPPPPGAWDPALPGYGPPGHSPARYGTPGYGPPGYRPAGYGPAAYGPGWPSAEDPGDDLFAGGEAETSVLPPLVIDDPRLAGGYGDGGYGDGGYGDGGYGYADGPAGPRHRAAGGHRRQRAGGSSRSISSSSGLFYPSADPHEASEGRRAQIASAVLGAVLVVAGFLTAWAAVSREGGLGGPGTRLSSSQQSALRHPAARHPAARHPQAAAPAASTSATPGAAQPAGAAAVALAPGTGQSPLAAPVQALLVQYFSAINSHRFSQYAPLFLPRVRRQLSAASFAAGYASTTDTGIVLVTLTTEPRSAAATATFVSRQRPAAGVPAATCTDWAITLFLSRHGTGYLIGAPPPGYHAYHHTCG
jgi:hypothetical protein